MTTGRPKDKRPKKRRRVLGRRSERQARALERLVERYPLSPATPERPAEVEKEITVLRQRTGRFA